LVLAPSVAAPPAQVKPRRSGLAGAAKNRNSRIMLGRRDLDPGFAAPFVSSVMQVEPGWIDYNGHLNMAYYNVLFDRAVDELYELLGCGLDYVTASRRSCFTAEVHIRYLRELHAGDPVRVTFQLLDFDAKRLHYFEQLHHADEGWLSATSENMTLHVDMDAKKTAVFPEVIAARLAAMTAAHAHLPVPEGAGRHIAMPSAN
jgi:acyl-CoA thioester hydrolase